VSPETRRKPDDKEFEMNAQEKARIAASSARDSPSILYKYATVSYFCQKSNRECSKKDAEPQS
jgi:hypothetical protein